MLVAKPLTRRAFWRRLRTLPAKGYKPKLDRDGAIRLRKGRECYCPITAVVHDMTGELFATYRAPQAANAIGLTETDSKTGYTFARHVMLSADNEREYNVYLPTLRRRLLSLLGLEEVGAAP